MTLTLPKLPDGTYPEVTVRYLASDEHFPPPDQHPLDPNAVVEQELFAVEEYRSQLNGARDGFGRVPSGAYGEKSFPVSSSDSPPSGFIRAGLNQLVLTARDTSDAVTRLTVFFNVVLGD